MEIKELFIVKESDTYSSILETFGLCKMIDTIFKSKEIDLTIKDYGGYFKIELSESINDKDLKKIKYKELMPVVDYIEKDNELSNAVKYSVLKIKSDNFKKFKKELIKNKDIEYRRKIENYENKPDDDWNIIVNIKKLKAKDGYNSAIRNYQIIKEKNIQVEFIKLLLENYSSLIINEDLKKKSKSLYNDFKDINSLQIFNSSQIKGANSYKIETVTPGPYKSFWINELLKMIGAFEIMNIKDVKISSKSWDTKIYVLFPNIGKYKNLINIFRHIKQNLSGSTSIKLDIFALLELIKQLIENEENFINQKPSFSKIKLSNYINGFYLSYLKDMGQAKSPTNISVLNLPDFIEIDSYKSGKKWIEILDEHKRIIKNIKIGIKPDELGQFIPMLQSYRQFLTTSDFKYFFDFNSEYSIFLMQNYGKTEKQKNGFVKPFKIKLLKEFFTMAEKKYGEILINKGFLNTAKAIRNSTINLQMMPKDSRKYDIKYGMAQDLKRKSAHNAELIEYLSEFMSNYNSETGKVKEKGGIGRQLIKTTDINNIIELIDKYGSNIVGKLLSAYGFASEPSLWLQKENGILIIKNNVIRIKDKEGKKEIKKIDFNFSIKTIEDFKILFESNNELKHLGLIEEEIKGLFEDLATITEDSSEEDESEE